MSLNSFITRLEAIAPSFFVLYTSLLQENFQMLNVVRFISQYDAFCKLKNVGMQINSSCPKKWQTLGELFFVLHMLFESRLRSSVYSSRHWTWIKSRKFRYTYTLWDNLDNVPVKCTAPAEILATSTSFEEGRVLCKATGFSLGLPLETNTIWGLKNLVNSLSTQKNSSGRSIHSNVHRFWYTKKLIVWMKYFG